jgi:23S rRNA pseudouridine1911/1915/1917 synthase
MAVSVEGKEARTRYEVRATFTDPAAVALVDCRLETGRTHQIRVHLAAIGHPVVGDRDYGGVRSGLAAPRPLLHARRLSFVHPRSGERLTFESPVPEDMAEVLAGLS